MATIEPAVSAAASRRLRVAALLVLAASVFGVFACDFLVASGITDGKPGSANAFFWLFAVNEPPFLWLLGAVAAVTWLLAHRRGSVGAPWPKSNRKSLATPALLAAVAVTMVTVAGAIAIMRSPPHPRSLVNALLAAISVLSLAGAATRLWPGDARRGRLAILYLATSTQFLLASMTTHVWPAHLCINLLWLYLVLRDDQFGLAAAPWVGVAALGVQNPLPHALFAAPFLLRVIRSRRIGWIAYYGALYGAGALAFYRWMSFVHAETGTRRALDLLGVPGTGRLFVEGMNFTALLTWQAPAMALFLVAALFLARAFQPAERDLLTGLVLTLAFYFFVPEADGQGWGYRHVYPILGTAALLAASATVSIAGQRGGALVSRLVVASAAIALLIQLPLRAVQAERATRPRVEALELPKTPRPAAKGPAPVRSRAAPKR